MLGSESGFPEHIMSIQVFLLTSFVAFCAAFPAGAVVYFPPNLLADPGFESGTVVPGATGGWNTIRATFSQDYAHSGQWSLRSPYVPTSFNAPALQYIGAVPGQQYRVSTWAFTPATLPAGLRGVLIMFFTDSNGSLLGNYNLAPHIVDQTTPANTWVELSLTFTAPSQAVSVYVEPTLINLASGTLPTGPAVYFDDVSLTAVPEPSCLAMILLGIGGVGCIAGRRLLQWFV